MRSGFIVLSWTFCASLLSWACLFFMRRHARWIFMTGRISALAEQPAYSHIWRGRLRRGFIFCAERLSDYEPAAARTRRYRSFGLARLLSAAHFANMAAISGVSLHLLQSLRRWFPGSICRCDTWSATVCWRETGFTSFTACLLLLPSRYGPFRSKSSFIWHGRWRCAKRQCARWRSSPWEYWWSPTRGECGWPFPPRRLKELNTTHSRGSIPSLLEY